jgi:hypothetical protein
VPNAELGKMERNYLKEKTKSFALQTIKLVESLPRGRTADFISKMGIVEEEADETIYWMELLIEAKLVQESDISPLLEEANQILAMTVSSIKTARRKTSK